MYNVKVKSKHHDGIRLIDYGVELPPYGETTLLVKSDNQLECLKCTAKLEVLNVENLDKPKKTRRGDD